MRTISLSEADANLRWLRGTLVRELGRIPGGSPLDTALRAATRITSWTADDVVDPEVWYGAIGDLLSMNFLSKALHRGDAQVLAVVRERQIAFSGNDISLGRGGEPNAARNFAWEVFAAAVCAALGPIDLDQVDLGARLVRNAVRKGGGRTDVLLHARAAEVIAAWLAVRGLSPGALFPSNVDRARRPTEELRRLCPRAIERRLAQLGEAAGLVARLHPHALRHAHATALLRAGVAVELIRQSLDHASLATTARYLHADDEMLRDAIARLPWLGAPGIVNSRAEPRSRFPGV